MYDQNDYMFYHIYTLSAAGAPFANDYSHAARRLGEIAKWIPHIKGLGMNAVLLGPALMSKTHGYDVTDYFKVDSRLGTNAEFKELVARFRDAGLRVALDSVFNHCGRDFFAFKELLNGNRDYAGWFSGVDFRQSSPLGDPFAYDCWSGCHDLVKFNLRNSDAKKYLLDAARYWITEFKIDGMRLDSANVIDFGFMRELRDAAASIKQDFWLMGEVVAGDYSRWTTDAALDGVTGYMLYKALFSSHNNNNLFELAHTVANSVPANGLPHYNFLDNHDQPRIADIVNDRAHLNTLYPLLFTLPGTPSVYYGSEWELLGRKENGSDRPLRPYIDIDHAPPETGVTRLIRKLAEIRGERPALRRGSYRHLYLQYQKPFVFERSHGGERVVVAVNISNKEEALIMDGRFTRDLLTGEPVNPANFTIRPHSAMIMA